MSLQRMSQHAAPWALQDAPERGIVVSSRIRLARNIAGQFFPHMLEEDALRALRGDVLDAARACPSLTDGLAWSMEELEELERRFLLERHLVSMELVREPMGRALLVSPDESCGLMINEEDHLRLQAFGSGLDPLSNLERALRLAGELEERLAFATSSRLGHLTACPTNVGTGLRASILVHLPGLVLTRDIEKVLNSLRVLNYTVRGFYGEGSGVMGSLFQISNTATLGLSEIQIVDDLLHHVRKVISVEREARAVLLERERARLEDRVWRAWGILVHARLLGTREAFDLLGDVRLGTCIQLLPRLDGSILETLLVTIQGAHLQIAEGRTLDASERDAARAETIRRSLLKAQREPEPGTRKDEE